MTFGEIYSEIILRAGEGYDAYLDRAKEMFWKAVSTLINKGEFTVEEVRRLERRNSVTLDKSAFTNNKYSLFEWFGTNDGPFHDNEVFSYRVWMTPIEPDNCRFTEVPYDRLLAKNPLNLLNEITGIPEVIYSFSYPDLLISPDTEEFSCMVNVATYSIPRTEITHSDGTTNTDTDSDRWFNYGFLVRAIELAAELLKTETE